MKLYNVEMIRLDYGNAVDIDNPPREVLEIITFSKRKDAVQTSKNIINNIMKDYDDRDKDGDGINFELHHEFDGDYFHATIDNDYDVIIRIGENELNYEAIDHRFDVYKY